MEKGIKKEEQVTTRDGRIHSVLSYAYFVFLLAVILGLIFDLLIEVNLGWSDIHNIIGFLALVAGPALVYWAQISSRRTAKLKEKGVSVDIFKQGPYRFLRNPSYLGVFIMSLGLALLLSSFFSIVFSILAYLIIRIVFVKKEELLLSHKYGESYNKYKEENKDII